MTHCNFNTHHPNKYIVGLWCAVCLLLGAGIYSATNIWGGISFWGLTGTLGVCWIHSRWNYPVLHDEFIEIKNIVFLNYSKKYKYEDIEHIEIPFVPYHNPCLAIKLKGRRFRRLHDINCVDFDTLDTLIGVLQQKGVSAMRKY